MKNDPREKLTDIVIYGGCSAWLLILLLLLAPFLV